MYYGFNPYWNNSSITVMWSDYIFWLEDWKDDYSGKFLRPSPPPPNRTGRVVAAAAAGSADVSDRGMRPGRDCRCRPFDLSKDTQSGLAVSHRSQARPGSSLRCRWNAPAYSWVMSFYQLWTHGTVTMSLLLRDDVWAASWVETRRTHRSLSPVMMSLASK